MTGYNRIFSRNTNMGDAKFFAQYPRLKMFKIVNRDLVMMDLIGMGSYAENKFEIICNLHKDILDGKLILNPTQLLYDKIELITFIRLIFDRLISMGYIYVYHDKFLENKKVEIDSIGSLKKNQQKYHELYRIIFGNEDEAMFLTILNELSNYFKHGFLLYESHAAISQDPENPAIIIYHIEKNDFKNLKYQTHNLLEIMFAFQNNIKRIAKNQQAWINAPETREKYRHYFEFLDEPR